jgi:hypothetical protein
VSISLAADSENILTKYSETFQRDGLILHPSVFRSESTRPQWVDVQSCLWRGPANLLEKTPLAAVTLYQNDTKIRRLFCEILSIKNAAWHDYLEMLVKLRRRQLIPLNLPDKVLQLYNLISQSNLSDEEWGSLS